MNSFSTQCRRGGLLLLLAIVLLVFHSTAIAQDADLTVAKTSDSSVVPADTDVSYEITVSNFSGQSSTPTNTLTDTIPAGMTFVSATTPIEWNCTLPAMGSGGTITCTYENAI